MELYVRMEVLVNHVEEVIKDINVNAHMDLVEDTAMLVCIFVLYISSLCYKLLYNCNIYYII